MFDTVFKLGWFELHSYGLMLMIAFLVGIYLTRKFAIKKGIKPDVLMDMALIIVISSIVGSRFLYVVFHFSEFESDWLRIINPVQPDGTFGIAGLSMLGGIVFAVISCFIFLKIKNVDFFKIADATVPAIAFGVFLVRIGCFGHGCCFGEECNLPWGVVFPTGTPAGVIFPDTPIHPTQIYSSLGGLVIFLVLLYLRKFRLRDGYLFFVFVILYSIIRFLIDFLRYYEDEVIVFERIGLPITINQAICIVGILYGLGSILYFERKKTA